MENFTFYSPTFFAFGKHTENEAGAYVKQFGGSKVLILSLRSAEYDCTKIYEMMV